MPRAAPAAWTGPAQEECMVSESDVVMAYRLFFGREPDSAEVVSEHAKANATVGQLRQTFIRSAEFAGVCQLPPSPPEHPPGSKPLVWPKVDCEVEVDPQVLQALLDRVRRQFEHLGRTEPHWSIISEEKYRSANAAGHEADFYQSGRDGIEDFRIAAQRCDLPLPTGGTCFELGCGMGRATIWLGSMFRRVIAADISASLLELARQAVQRFDRPNVTLLQVRSLPELAELPPYEAFFSGLVLQHNPPPLIAYMLKLILGRLVPGGVAYFQVPTYGFKYGFKAAAYLASLERLAEPPMHILPQPHLFRIIAESGCRLLEMREDDAGGPHMISNRVMVQRLPR
jgi:SAM-dependent methyltransferase